MVTYPKDWEKDVLDNLFYITAGGDVNRNTFSINKTLRCCYPIFSNGIENRGLYGYTSHPTYTEDSLTITARGTIGVVFYRNIKFDAIIRLLVLTKKNLKKVYPKFYYYFINHNVEFLKESTGVPQLTAPKVKDILVPVPSFLEQKAIASVLTDFYDHIESLDKLIQKKKDIRDGALEDLVSGKTRLKGFNDEWHTIPFSKYFKFLSTNTLSREQLSDRGNIYNVHYGDVLVRYGCILSENEFIPKVKDEDTIKNNDFLIENDVIIADTAEDETVGKAVQIGKIEGKCVSGLHTFACRPIYPTANKYLGYYINSKSFHEQLIPYITGIKVSSISKASIKKTEVYIPSDINEQKAIADILTSMDSEIEVLEKEKEKFMQLKEAAMEDLLTGKVRLKI